MIYAQPGTRGVAGQDPPVPMEKTVGVTQEHPHPSPSKSLGTIKAHRDPSQETPLLCSKGPRAPRKSAGGMERSCSQHCTCRRGGIPQAAFIKHVLWAALLIGMDGRAPLDLGGKRRRMMTGGSSILSGPD